MKIVICGSMSASQEMVNAEQFLTKLGHKVILPKHTHEYASGLLSPETHEESAKNKQEEDLIRRYFEIIKNCDAVLAINVNKKDKSNYIGGNTLIEMAFAHVLSKKLYILNDLLDRPSYHDEIIALNPTILHGDLSGIRDAK